MNAHLLRVYTSNHRHITINYTAKCLFGVFSLSWLEWNGGSERQNGYAILLSRVLIDVHLVLCDPTPHLPETYTYQCPEMVFLLGVFCIDIIVNYGFEWVKCALFTHSLKLTTAIILFNQDVSQLICYKYVGWNPN